MGGVPSGRSLEKNGCVRRKIVSPFGGLSSLWLLSELVYPVGTEKADVLEVTRGGARFPDLYGLSG